MLTGPKRKILGLDDSMTAKVARGEVWIVDLGMVAKIRPCLVLSIPSDYENDRVLTTINSPKWKGRSSIGLAWTTSSPKAPKRIFRWHSVACVVAVRSLAVVQWSSNGDFMGPSILIAVSKLPIATMTEECRSDPAKRVLAFC